MDNQSNNQENLITDRTLLFIAMRDRGIRQAPVAKFIGCTQGAISQALKEKDETKFQDIIIGINKYIWRWDRKKAKRLEHKNRRVA